MSRAVFLSLFALSPLFAQEPGLSAGAGSAAPPPVPAEFLDSPAAAVLVPAPAAALPLMPPPVPGQLEGAPAAMPPQSFPPAPAPVPSEVQPPVQAGAVTPTPLPRAKASSSTSSSGQFIVHGEDATLRNAIGLKCEDIARELRSLLKDKESWTLPMVVFVTSGEEARKASKSVGTVISQLSHGGFHIQVNVNMRPDLRPSDLRNEVIRALLAERILRNHKNITSKRSLLLPDWLFLGIVEASDYRRRTRPSALFAAIFKSGKIFGIEEIIEASASDIEDSLSKTIYQTSCCALVLALLDQPESGMRLARFLNSLADDPRSERELLNHWFPTFATSEASLNKWWALQLATLASPGMGEPLSPQETVIALEEALILRFQARPSELPKNAKRIPSARESLAGTQAGAPAVSLPAPAPVSQPDPTPVPPRKTEKSLPKITSASTPEPETVSAPPEEAPEAEEKSGFMSRLNPFSRRSKSADDDINAAIAEAARAEAAQISDMPPEAPAEAANTMSAAPPPPPEGSQREAPRRKPLLSRFFDEETPEAAEETAPPPADMPVPAPARPEAKTSPSKAPPAPPPAPAPAAEPAPKPAEEETEKPSGLNPFNWFRGSKKDKGVTPEEKPAEEAAKDKSAFRPASHGQSLDLAAQLQSGQTITALVMQETAVPENAAEEDEEKGSRRGFLGLFGRKKAEADPAEPEVPQPAPPAVPSPPVPAPAKKSSPAEPSPAPAPEASPPEDSDKEKAPRQPLRLRLFGNGKDEKEAAEMPPEPAEASPPMEAVLNEAAAPQPKPKPKPKPQPKPAPKKSDSKPDEKEPLVMASLPIEEYAAIQKRKDLVKILEPNVGVLNALRNRGAVLFRPIAADYLAVLGDIAKGRSRGVDARLKELRELTKAALAKSHEVRDMLDLHEANTTPAMSGLFEDYLKLPETIGNELPARSDAISKYLDALDKEFSKE